MEMEGIERHFFAVFSVVDVSQTRPISFDANLGDSEQASAKFPNYNIFNVLSIAYFRIRFAILIIIILAQAACDICYGAKAITTVLTGKTY